MTEHVQFGTLTANVGNMQCSISYQPQMLTVDTVTAILFANVVCNDDPVITVALQVRDVRYSSNLLPTAVEIQVTHPTTPDDWSANISVQYGIVGSSNNES